MSLLVYVLFALHGGGECHDTHVKISRQLGVTCSHLPSCFHLPHLFFVVVEDTITNIILGGKGLVGLHFQGTVHPAEQSWSLTPELKQEPWRGLYLTPPLTRSAHAQRASSNRLDSCLGLVPPTGAGPAALTSNQNKFFKYAHEQPGWGNPSTDAPFP